MKKLNYINRKCRYENIYTEHIYQYILKNKYNSSAPGSAPGLLRVTVHNRNYTYSLSSNRVNPFDLKVINTRITILVFIITMYWKAIFKY